MTFKLRPRVPKIPESWDMQATQTTIILLNKLFFRSFNNILLLFLCGTFFKDIIMFTPTYLKLCTKDVLNNFLLKKMGIALLNYSKD